MFPQFLYKFLSLSSMWRGQCQTIECPLFKFGAPMIFPGERWLVRFDPCVLLVELIRRSHAHVIDLYTQSLKSMVTSWWRRWIHVLMNFPPTPRITFIFNNIQIFLYDFTIFNFKFVISNFNNNNCNITNMITFLQSNNIHIITSWWQHTMDTLSFDLGEFLLQ